MTNKEIKKIKQEVCEIQTKSPSKELSERIIQLAKEIGASLPHWAAGGDSDQRNIINQTSQNVHIVLQTEMMFNACIFAQRSCFWAAIAAIASCISVLLVLFCA
jgi:hypothetical protein